MPTLVLNNVPVPLYDQIQRLALSRKCTASDTAVDVLQNALRSNTDALESAPIRNGIYLTEEITAPFSLPRPEGTLADAIRVDPPLPSAHDIPEGE